MNSLIHLKYKQNSYNHHLRTLNNIINTKQLQLSSLRSSINPSKMLQPHPFPPQPKIQQNKHQSLQLNRLINFIESKKSPSSQKLKEILLSKDCPLNKGPSVSQRPGPENKNNQKSQRESIAVSTRNIFVARNKTESSSPRAPQEVENKYYKIFITKQEILKLHEKQKSQYLPSGLKQKFNFNLITNPEERHKSNLFPPLAMPKVKRPVIFNKYQDQTTTWLNTQIKNIQEVLSSSNGPNTIYEESNTISHKQTEKFQQMHLHRQKYNKSLQKLIEKAFKSKDKKNNSPQKLNTIFQGIQGYDSKLFVHGQNYDAESQNREYSVYASKGKLLSNPNLKIKKDARFKSQKRQLPDKLTITIDPEQLPVTETELKKIFDSEYKRRIIHTNREAIYLEYSLKLKTQVTTKQADYLPSSIRNRSNKKTLKLISELQSSIMEPQYEGEKSSRKRIKAPKFSQKFIDQKASSTIDKFIQQNKQKHESQRLRRKHQQRKMKVKTLINNELPQHKKSATKWQIAGYDRRQSTDELQQNIQLQKYVQKIVKKSDPIPLDLKQLPQ